MNHNGTAGEDREGRLSEVLADWLEAAERGAPPEEGEYLRRYPEFAAELAECFADWKRFPRPGGPATRPLAALEPPLPERGLLGDFRIVREVGRGGMGVVYEAEQVSLSRRVALKVLPFAAALDPKQLQRFKNEAQAAAGLHHTHIVPVYYVGCERAVHFYAMQFIDGQSLAEVVRELRRLAGREPAGDGAAAGPLAGALPPGQRRPTDDPAEQPTTAYVPPPAAPAVSPSTAKVGAFSTERSAGGREHIRAVARLGAQAGEALDHAHQVGIVHRDVKPANLLVDARGHLWVTDFGLVQMQKDSGLTMSGDLIGTLRYMSPEQALARHGLVDHRTDIYSLGATLYELLTLETPLGGTDRQELLRQIAFEEPRPLRRLNKSIPAELETIVLKAMEKNPAERYATAQELADDLRRFLEDKPIRARRPSLRERMIKWSRRHKPVVASSLALLIMAVVGLTMSTVLIWREKDRANQRFEFARRAVDDMYTQVAEKWLADQPQLTDVQRQFLEKALAFYQEFAAEQSSQPAVQLEVCRAYLRVAAIQQKLGQHRRSEEAYDRALAIAEQLATAYPTVAQYRLDLAVTHNQLARVLIAVGQRGQACEHLRQAIDSESQLATDFPAEPVYRRNLASGYGNLATLMRQSGERAEALKLQRQAVDLFTKLTIDFVSVPDYRRDLAASYEDLATLLNEGGERAQAEKLQRQALDMVAKLVKNFPTVSEYRQDLASGHAQLGGLLREGGAGRRP
jgi:serine/threonine protein kinase